VAESIFFEFEINVYTITASSSSGGQITPKGTTSVNAGGSVYYYFTAEVGYYVKQIIIDGISLAGDDLSFAISNGYTFENVNDNHEVSVYFEIYKFTITAIASEGGNISPEGEILANHGESKTFIFAANE
jgi:hypothetical protein